MDQHGGRTGIQVNRRTRLSDGQMKRTFRTACQPQSAGKTGKGLTIGSSFVPCHWSFVNCASDIK